jgi:hypothetical protein
MADTFSAFEHTKLENLITLIQLAIWRFGVVNCSSTASSCRLFTPCRLVFNDIFMVMFR